MVVVKLVRRNFICDVICEGDDKKKFTIRDRRINNAKGWNNNSDQLIFYFYINISIKI